jgi:hypothetical protein
VILVRQPLIELPLSPTAVIGTQIGDFGPMRTDGL